MKLPYFTACHSSNDPDAIILDLHSEAADGSEAVSMVTFDDATHLMDLDKLAKELTKLVRDAAKTGA